MKRDQSFSDSVLLQYFFALTGSSLVGNETLEHERYVVVKAYNFIVYLHTKNVLIPPQLGITYCGIQA